MNYLSMYTPRQRSILRKNGLVKPLHRSGSSIVVDLLDQNVLDASQNNKTFFCKMSEGYKTFLVKKV